MKWFFNTYWKKWSEDFYWRKTNNKNEIIEKVFDGLNIAKGKNHNDILYINCDHDNDMIQLYFYAIYIINFLIKIYYIK